MARERGLYRRKDSRFWWINLVLADGRRVCQSTGCVDRTAAEAFAVRLKSEALEARQQGLLGIVVWQQAVVRYLEEFGDKKSLPDDKDHLKKLDPLSPVPAVGCDRHDGIAAVHPRSQVEGWCLERDHQSRTRGGSADLERRATGLALAPWGSEDSNAEGTPPARALPETRGG